MFDCHSIVFANSFNVQSENPELGVLWEADRGHLEYPGGKAAACSTNISWFVFGLKTVDNTTPCFIIGHFISDLIILMRLFFSVTHKKPTTRHNRPVLFPHILTFT